jgi:hypothetical protein
MKTVDAMGKIIGYVWIYRGIHVLLHFPIREPALTPCWRRSNTQALGDSDLRVIFVRTAQ